MTDPSVDAPWRLPNLANRALGAGVVWCNDEFYGDAHRLLIPAAPTHDVSAYDVRGKVYDGWETRRRREPGSDQVIIRLAAPALLKAIDVDTAFFKGNAPTHASIETATRFGYPDADTMRVADWTPLIERSALKPDSSNPLLPKDTDRLATHLRLTIYPDGGVARLRAHGEAVPDPAWLGGRVDLASVLVGGRVTDCSNMFYASPDNMLAPGRSAVMSDGWETARRRDEGCDWAIVKLGVPGVLHDVTIDTLRFVGNAPGFFSLADADSGTELLERTALLPDTEHRFRLHHRETVASVKVKIYPDGGISRLRLNGEIPHSEREKVLRRWLELLPDDVATGQDRDGFFS